MTKGGFLNTFNKLDIFGEEVSFNAKGNSSIKSFVGSILSLVLFILTLIYTYQRGQVLLEYQDTRFQ